MANFLQYLRASESNNGRTGPVFDGSPVTSAADLREGGWGEVRAKETRYYQESLREAQRLYDQVLGGNKWAALRFQEALTTSDFPLLFGDILDRSILSNYAETPYTWDLYAKRATIQDFRQAKIFRVDHGAGVLDGPILPNSYGARGNGPDGLEQVTEYPQMYRTSTGYVDQLYKFGRRMDFAWEVILNDDLDALRDTPALFGRAARRTEESRATKLYANSTGPNATFFSNTHKNLLNVTNLTTLATQYGLPNNPHFSITALQAAIQLMQNQRDLDGEPISVEAWVLVYPPALDVAVKNVLNATQVWMNDQGGTTGLGNTGSEVQTTQSAVSLQRLLAENWAKQIVKPAKNYYLPIVDTTSGQTAWYLFADPAKGRPAMQQSFLRSQPAPQLFQKLPNNVAIGEGSMGPGAGSMPGTTNANPMEGDFETDAICYKVRHVLGGTLLDPIMGVASTGVDA